MRDNVTNKRGIKEIDNLVQMIGDSLKPNVAETHRKGVMSQICRKIIIARWVVQSGNFDSLSISLDRLKDQVREELEEGRFMDGKNPDDIYEKIEKMRENHCPKPKHKTKYRRRILTKSYSTGSLLSPQR